MQENESDSTIRDAVAHPWPDEHEGAAVPELNEMAGSEPCACLLSETGMLGSLVRDFYSQMWK